MAWRTSGSSVDQEPAKTGRRGTDVKVEARRAEKPSAGRRKTRFSTPSPSGGSAAIGTIELTGRRRRQPGLVAAGLLLVALAALGGTLLFTRLTSTTTVLVAAREIGPGEVVAESDLRAVELTNVGPAATIGVGAQGRILGRVSRGSIPAGTVLNEDLFAASGSAVPPGMAVVGAALEPGAAPGPGLRPGDRVDVLAVGSSTIGLEATGDSGADVVASAVVWSVDDSGSAVGGRLVVSLLVPLEAQTLVAQAAADNRLRLSLTGQ